MTNDTGTTPNQALQDRAEAAGVPMTNDETTPTEATQILKGALDRLEADMRKLNRLAADELRDLGRHKEHNRRDLEGCFIRLAAEAFVTGEHWWSEVECGVGAALDVLRRAHVEGADA